MLPVDELIPHAGSMCLLDTVERWDQDEIVCRASSHDDPDNPLSEDGRLAAVALVEYGAQAAAVHAALAGAGIGDGRCDFFRHEHPSCAQHGRSDDLHR